MDEASTQPEVQDQRDGSTSAPLTTWLLWVSLLFAAYILSTGPAVKIHRKYPAARPALEAFYMPVQYMAENSGPAEKFFQWYLDSVWKAYRP